MWFPQLRLNPGYDVTHMLRSVLGMFLLSIALGAAADPQTPAPVQSVSDVDLARYGGTWHEVARFPMYFQNQCVGDVTAQYSLLESGRIKVVNRCRTKTGQLKKSEGNASVVKNSGNAQLKVSFFWPFRADYWVIGLDPQYRWAVVGTPNRKYLWILSRSARMAADDLSAAKAIASQQGFDVERLIASERRSGE